MVAYVDIPTVTSLHEEQARVTSAISLLDSGGTVGVITVAPPPTDPENLMPSMSMPVSIMTPNSPQELLDQVRLALVARSTEISAELLALGVTDSPPPAV